VWGRFIVAVKEMIRRGLSRVSLTARASGITRGGDGHHGARMLPFARLAPPSQNVSNSLCDLIKYFSSDELS
jgi:hypothetical protein